MGEPEALLRLAVARGCHHYAPQDPGSQALMLDDPGTEILGNEELGVAMITAAQRHEPQLIRCAAQLLSATDISAAKLARLAQMERCAPLLAYIARHALKWDVSRRDFWSDLLDRLPPGGPRSSVLWPHPSRFVIQAGYQRGGGAPAPVWLSRRAGRENA